MGSAPSLSTMLAPVAARSVHGENSTAPAGSGSPASRGNCGLTRALDPFATQRFAVRTVQFPKTPATRHVRRPGSLRGQCARFLNIDMRLQGLRAKLPAQKPARDYALPTHWDILPGKCPTMV